MYGELQADCVGLTGDLASGVLLSRIAYWQPKARLRWDDGIPFIAKSREEWQVETGLTAKQFRRAWGNLKTLGLIDVEYHIFGNRRVMHVRLYGRAFDLPLQEGDGLVGVLPGVEGEQTVDPKGPPGPLRSGPPGHVRSGPPGPVRSGPPGPPDIKNTSTAEETTMNDTPKGLHVIGSKRSKDAHAAVTRIKQEVSLDDLLSRRPTVDNVGLVWQVSYRRAYPGEIVGGWSRTWGPRVKDLMREVPGAVSLMSNVVLSWPEFCDRVKERTGENLPTRPHFLKIFRHRAVLETFKVSVLEPSLAGQQKSKVVTVIPKKW